MAAGSYLELKVSDTGHGIDPAILSRIFDPFFTTKKKGEGTGMGLAVVYGIVKSYGGRVSVTSTVGKGTTFTVYFPVIHQQMILPQNDVREEISMGKERILLIDDQDYLLQIMKIMLTRLGYTVTAKQSSPDALALFMADPDAFDMIITDQTMPELTGAELTKKVLSIRPNLPIVLCTGFSDLVSREEAKLIGIREYIMKPVDIRDIAKIIRNVLEGKEGCG
jgi:two-component system, cell cycle sensor histidine kinase and response regulator CckA